MPRYVFSLPDGTIVYIRPENEFRVKYGGGSNILTIPEWANNTRIQELAAMMHEIEPGSTLRGRYKRYKSDLSYQQQMELRRLMADVLPMEFKEPLEKRLKEGLTNIESDPVTEAMTERNNGVYTATLHGKVISNKTKIETLQKWAKYGGIYYSVVTPELDEYRCILDWNEAPDEFPSSEARANFKKNGPPHVTKGKEYGHDKTTRRPSTRAAMKAQARQPFAHDIHTSDRDLLKMLKPKPDMTPEEEKEFNAWMMRNFEKARTVIGHVLERKEQWKAIDGKEHLLDPIFMRVDGRMEATSFGLPVKKQDVSSEDLEEWKLFLARIGVPVTNGNISSTHLEQALQKYGFTLEPSLEDELEALKRDDHAHPSAAKKQKIALMQERLDKKCGYYARVANGGQRKHLGKFEIESNIDEFARYVNNADTIERLDAVIARTKKYLEEIRKTEHTIRKVDAKAWKERLVSIINSREARVQAIRAAGIER